jgi:hypothetical protein
MKDSFEIQSIFMKEWKTNIRGSSMWALFCSKCEVMFHNIDAKCSNKKNTKFNAFELLF